MCNSSDYARGIDDMIKFQIIALLLTLIIYCFILSII